MDTPDTPACQWPGSGQPPRVSVDGKLVPSIIPDPCPTVAGDWAARLTETLPGLRVDVCDQHAVTARALGWYVIGVDDASPMSDQEAMTILGERVLRGATTRKAAGELLDGIRAVTDQHRFYAWKADLHRLTDSDLAEWAARSDLHPEQREAVLVEQYRRDAATGRMERIDEPYATSGTVVDRVPVPQRPLRAAVAWTLLGAFVAVSLAAEAWEAHRSRRAGRRLLGELSAWLEENRG